MPEDLDPIYIKLINSLKNYYRESYSNPSYAGKLRIIDNVNSGFIQLELANQKIALLKPDLSDKDGLKLFNSLEQSFKLIVIPDSLTDTRTKRRKLSPYFEIKERFKIVNQAGTCNFLLWEKQKTISSLAADKYYTPKSLAKSLIDQTLAAMQKRGGYPKILFVEPSAGAGAFSDQLSPCLAIDIIPASSGIVKADFLSADFDKLLSKERKQRKVICIGNPPFGKNSSLAVKFFNKAAKFSEIIAFIVPLTFKKESLKNRLDLNFHLLSETSTSDADFKLEGNPIKVPSCFQIWIRRKDKRQKSISLKESKYIKFTNQKAAELAIRRVGVYAGRAYLESKDKSPSSHYFIINNCSQIKTKKLLELINSIDFNDISSNTTGPRSLSKSEFIRVFDQRIKTYLERLKN